MGKDIREGEETPGSKLSILWKNLEFFEIFFLSRLENSCGVLLIKEFFFEIFSLVISLLFRLQVIDSPLSYYELNYTRLNKYYR